MELQLRHSLSFAVISWGVLAAVACASPEREEPSGPPERDAAPQRDGAGAPRDTAP